MLVPALRSPSDCLDCRPAGCWPSSFSTTKESHDETLGAAALTADAKTLPHTIVTPHLETPIKPGQNVLWCSTSNSSGTKPCRAAGGDIHLSKSRLWWPVEQRKLPPERTSTTPVVSSCRAGPRRRRRRDSQGARRKFQGRASPDLLDHIAPGLPADGWLAYAYLFRELPFKYPFKRLDEPLAFGPKQVASFGLQKATCRMDDVHTAEQVVILDYKDADDFVLELKPEHEGERIIWRRSPRPKRCKRRSRRFGRGRKPPIISSWRESLGDGESLVVPILNFDVWRSYDELCGEITTPGPFRGHPISSAMQDIRFRLDERGAILKSEATMVKSGAGPTRRGSFIFDRPFLILLKRRGASQP